MRGRSRIGGGIQDRATWVVLLALALGVLLPAACVIWFMAEAASNQADAARQRLSDAFRGQLRLLRDRVDSDWRSRVARLGREAGGGTAFHRAVTGGGLDSIVFLGAGDSPGYPALSSPAVDDGFERRPDWQIATTLEVSGSYAAAAARYATIAARERTPNRAALAAQAHVRTLVKARDTSAALQAIERHFSAPRVASGRDRLGRLIAADAWLLALRLTPPSDIRFRKNADRLAALLGDYEGAPMPSSQRLFLMSELRVSAGADVTLPTYAAERLAAEFLEADGVPPAGAALEATRLRDVWKLAVGGRAVALFRTETVTSIADALLRGQSAATGARFVMVPPGRDGGIEAVAASPLLPGWLIGVSLIDADSIDPTAGQRVATYLWAGTLAVAGLTIAGLLLWQAFRRQLRVSRLKTDLVAAVSHELRTPLSSMHALVDLMLENPEIDRHRTREYLQMIAGENARLSRLIEHFLAFSRIDRKGGQGLIFRDVSPAALVGQAVTTVPGRERFPGLAIQVAPDVPSLYADEDALVTVLLNLLENAYKYTGDEKRVFLRVHPDAASVVIEVEDNGIGIGRRDRTRIFRPFYQADQRLARERGGCGLGLSIVDVIVRAHGGRVTVSSEVGAGSLFRVVLPSRMSGRKAAVA